MTNGCFSTFYRENARVGVGFTPARLREGVKPSPTFLCASPKESGVLRTGAFMRGGDKIFAS